MVAKPQVDIGEYQYGFRDEEDYVFKSGRGADPRHRRRDLGDEGRARVDARFSAEGARALPEAPDAELGRDLSGIDFDDIFYYIRPAEKQGKTWDEVPEYIKNTFEKLGIPEAERKFLAGVGAQYESEVIYHSLREDLEKLGVIFLDMDSGVREHPELVKQYFGTIIPYNDNKFAALNSAVWSGGSFIYVPPGVRIDVPLQAYFRINAENMGQFERTLIIVDKDAYVHYVEGCTAPTYTTNSLHSAVVEIIVLEGGRCRYTTIQNWSKNVYNLVTKRAAAYKNATMEWVDGNLGSKVTMKYPAVWLMEEGARGEILSVAFASDGQHQDAGGKVVHVAPRTSSQIISKSISKGTGRSSYRGLVKVYKGAEEVRSNVVCDALLLDETSKTDTYPYIEIEEERALDRSRGDGLEGGGRADLLPDEPRPHRGRGDEHDRQRVHRADRQGAAARVRGRAQPADPARDGRIGRLTKVGRAGRCCAPLSAFIDWRSPIHEYHR